MKDAARRLSGAETIEASLIDDFSRDVFKGALRVAADRDNPIRLGLFAAAVRELCSHTLSEAAPDAEVTACGWYAPEPDATGPTIGQRVKFVTQGTLPDSFVEEAGVDAARIHGQAMNALAALRTYTDVSAGLTGADDGEVDQYVNDALVALKGLFSALEVGRSEVLRGLYDHADGAGRSVSLW